MTKGKLSGSIYRWLLLAAATCIALSCSSKHLDDGENVSGCLPLILKVDSGTGVSPMEAGTTVGVFFMSKGSGEAFRTNEMLIVDHDGMLMQGRDTVVPSNTGQYDFFAYSPYSSGWDEVADAVVEYDVEPDQTSSLHYQASDLMLSYMIERKDDHDEAVFRHVMAKILVHITDKTGTFDMRFASALLRDMKLRSYIYMGEGTCRTDESVISDVECRPLECMDRRASFAAVVPPQDVVAGKLEMIIGIGANSYDFAVPYMDMLTGGKVHVFNMRMTERGLELEDTQVNDWEDAGGGNMNVAFQ